MKLEDWHIKAMQWANEHQTHVDALVKSASLSYAPSLTEDKQNPQLWKAEHWKWLYESVLS